MTRLAPLWQQNSQYPAATDRALLQVLFPAGGSFGHKVAAVAGTMNVNIPVGTTAVPMGAGGVNGVELCRSDAAEVVTLTNAPASGQNRIDLIILQVRDSALDAGINNDWIFDKVTGVPAASNPAVPAVPTNAIAMANVLVPGGAVNLNTATVTDRRRGVPTAPYRFRYWRTTNLTNIPGDGIQPPLVWEASDDPLAIIPPGGSQYVCPFDGLLLVSWNVLESTGGTATNPNMTSYLTSVVGTPLRRGSQTGLTQSAFISSVCSVGTTILPVTAGYPLQLQPYISAAGATKTINAQAQGEYTWLEGLYLAYS